MTLALHNVEVVKGGATILKSVNGTLAAGRLTAIAGPNGAGKSTLLRAAAGLETLASGHINGPKGTDLAHATAAERARTVCWIPDATHVPFRYTALATVILGRYPWHDGRAGATDRDRALAALASMGVANLAERTMPSLSAGERHKVLIARAFAGDAPILLLDEPCANLDIAATLALLALLRDLAAAGRTVAVTLHDLSLATRFADDVLCLAKGSVAAHGPAQTTMTDTLISTVFGVRARHAPGLVLDLQ